MWTKKKEKAEAEAVTAEEAVAKQAQREIERREFCISHAAMMEGVHTGNVIKVAQEIYSWTYGVSI